MGQSNTCLLMEKTFDFTAIVKYYADDMQLYHNKRPVV